MKMSNVRPAPKVPKVLYLKKMQSERLLKWILICVMQFGMTACATGGFMDNYPRHSFSFDTRHDSPDAEVLDYQYSNSRHNGVRPERERVAMGQDFVGTNISGSILRGDFLYVKWRIKDPRNPTEHIGYYEDKVDLKKRLPADISGLRVHFVVNGPQLYVYLISPGLKPASEPAGPLLKYELQKQIQIYPDQPK